MLILDLRRFLLTPLREGRLINLRDLAVHHVTAVGSCDHCRGRGEVPLLRTAVIDIGFVHANHVEAETAEVQRTHIGNAVIGAELLINRADDDAAIAVKQLLAKAPVMSYAVSEYVFLQADSEQDAAQAVKILQTRIDSQADGDAFYPETIDQWKAAKVLQNGAYVAMIASGEHQTEIEDAWNAQFGA